MCKVFTITELQYKTGSELSALFRIVTQELHETYLLNMDHRKALDKELSKLKNRKEEEKQLDPTGVERFDYVSRVIEIHQNMRQGTFMPECVALRVYQRFEFASAFAHA